MKMRKERDREIQERNATDKIEREAERKRKADEADEKKRLQMESVKNYTGYLGQKRNKGNKRITEREKKRKVLRVGGNGKWWVLTVFGRFSVIIIIFRYFSSFFLLFSAIFSIFHTLRIDRQKRTSKHRPFNQRETGRKSGNLANPSGIVRTRKVRFRDGGGQSKIPDKSTTSSDLYVASKKRLG